MLNVEIKFLKALLFGSFEQIIFYQLREKKIQFSIPNITHLGAKGHNANNHNKQKEWD